MKTTKKLLAIILSVLMLMGSMSIAAFGYAIATTERIAVPLNDDNPSAITTGEGAEFTAIKLGNLEFDMGFFYSTHDGGEIQNINVYCKNLRTDSQETLSYLNDGYDIALAGEAVSDVLTYWNPNATGSGVLARNLGFFTISEKSATKPWTPGSYKISIQLEKDNHIISLSSMTINIPEGLFSNAYDVLYLDKTLVDENNYWDTELTFSGYNYPADSGVQKTFMVFTGIATYSKYTQSTLPEYENVKKIPKGLKVTGYIYYDKNSNENTANAGDIPINGGTYYANMALDFSDISTFFNGIVNYIVWKITFPLAKALAV